MRWNQNEDKCNDLMGENTKPQNKLIWVGTLDI